MNQDAPDKDNSETTVFTKEDNDAGNQFELADDATASQGPRSHTY